MPEPTGLIFDIQKFSIHDGPGIRTTVFLKGCPLNCLWCHNPESKDSAPEISFIADRCILCGGCVAACRNGCHRIDGRLHRFHRTACTRCGACARACHAKALQVIGRPMTVPEVLEEVLKDVSFYETSGGGMTVSGGEPMLPFEFTKALLTEARHNALHNCLETSGYSTLDRLLQIMPVVDLFLFDIKETDPERHKAFTGVPLDTILNNLLDLDRAGAKTVLRCPIIPGVNDRTAHLHEIAALADRLVNLIEVNVLTYHPLGRSKSERIGRSYPLDTTTFPDEADVRRWIDTLKPLTNKPVRQS